jgi:hypothetical protein
VGVGKETGDPLILEGMHDPGGGNAYDVHSEYDNVK